MNKQLKKIIYAEDQADLQMIARVALENVGGFEVMICNNGQEAVDAVPDFQPDLLLLDVMMPVMDGPTALKTIREFCPDIPAIFITAKVRPDEVVRLKAMNAEVISKPYNPMELSDQVKAIWVNLSK